MLIPLNSTLFFILLGFMFIPLNSTRFFFKENDIWFNILLTLYFNFDKKNIYIDLNSLKNIILILFI